MAHSSISSNFTRKAPARAPPAIYHVHGDGMILGSVASFTPAILARTRSYDLSITSIEYRLTPESPHPVPVDNCYAGLEWLRTDASELGVDCRRIVVPGESAVGGIAVGITLMARDKGLSPPVAYQILIYPCSTTGTCSISLVSNYIPNRDRTTIRPAVAALRGEAAGQDGEVAGPQYAAPARAQNLSGGHLTYIDVIHLDYSATEDVEYAARLLAAV